MSFTSARPHLLLSLILLISAAPLAAVDVIPGEWRSLGPEGGFIQELIAAPGNPQVMYAVSQGTLYRSRDGGAGWNVVSEATFQVTVDAANPSLLYALRSLEMARSFDGGGSWFSLDLPAPSIQVQRLVAHPRFAKTVFALANVGLFQSTNAGSSWRRLQRGLPASYRADLLVIDPFAPRRLYLALQDIAAQAPRLYKSLDGGATWQRIDSGPLAGKPILAVATRPRSSRVLYASTPEDVYKSTDGGRSWAAIGHRGGVEGITQSLAVQPDRPAVLYAGSSNGLYRSQDAGATWQWLLAGADVQSLLFLPQGLFANFLLPDQPDGIFKSTDGGLSWTFASRGIRALTVTAIRIGEPGTIWILADNKLLFRSTDQGRTWSVIRPDPGVTLPPTGLAVDPADRSNVFVLYSDGAVWRSGDAGGTWEAAGNAGLQTLDLEIDPQTPSTLYAAGYGGIAKSTDRGDTWTALPVENALYHELDVAPSSPSTLYVGATGEDFLPFFLRSQDGGATWTRLSLDVQDAILPNLAVDPRVATTVYTASDEHILKSTDAGETWSIVSETIDAGAIYPIETSASGQRLYAAMWDLGVYALDEGSLTWAVLGDQNLPWGFEALAVDPHDPCRIYAGAQFKSLLEFNIFGTGECR
ncbi:MAG: WD40/YVTN/BNR-like repeat-containing protein [Thermoanaerobaculia bacterium]